MTVPRLPYVGRFAPTPSGPLHFGSLVAATGSWLEARAHAGRWLLRIEDLDTPRKVPGAEEAILAALGAFGFEWDGPVVRQSERSGAYAAAFEQLRRAGQIYPCACTRREIADSALGRDGSPRYPGTCRDGLPPGRRPRAWRVRAEGLACFDDAIQGPQREELAEEIGDFIVRRADGIFAYQLAVVVDDAEAGVSHVVRGADLLESTGRQILLQRLLGLPQPAYAHLPVAANTAGEKLSKQTLARALDAASAPATLVAALDFLGQRPPPALARASLAEVWAWAGAHWRLEQVPRCRSIAVASTHDEECP